MRTTIEQLLSWLDDEECCPALEIGLPLDSGQSTAIDLPLPYPYESFSPYSFPTTTMVDHNFVRLFKNVLAAVKAGHFPICVKGISPQYEGIWLRVIFELISLTPDLAPKRCVYVVVPTNRSSSMAVYTHYRGHLIKANFKSFEEAVFCFDDYISETFFIVNGVVSADCLEDGVDLLLFDTPELTFAKQVDLYDTSAFKMGLSFPVFVEFVKKSHPGIFDNRDPKTLYLACSGYISVLEKMMSVGDALYVH